MHTAAARGVDAYADQLQVQLYPEEQLVLQERSIQISTSYIYSFSAYYKTYHSIQKHILDTIMPLARSIPGKVSDIP